MNSLEMFIWLAVIFGFINAFFTSLNARTTNTGCTPSKNLFDYMFIDK